MMAMLLIGLLAALAILHLYWAAGGRWPGNDDETFVLIVVGRKGSRRAPGPIACMAVALALLSSALLVALMADIVTLEILPWALVEVGFWGAPPVFFARGIAGYIPSLTRHAKDTPFYRLNQFFYSPLCLLIAVAFALVGI